MSGSTSFKLNDTEIDLPIFNGKKSYESIDVVPSTLMRTPTEAFSELHAELLKEGEKSISVSFENGNVVINELLAVINGDKGKHFVKLKEPLVLDGTLFNSNTIDTIYMKVVYNENDTTNGLYPKDELSIEVRQTTNQPGGGETPPAGYTKIVDIDYDNKTVDEHWRIDNIVNVPSTETYISATTTDIILDADYAGQSAGDVSLNGAEWCISRKGDFVSLSGKFQIALSSAITLPNENRCYLKLDLKKILETLIPNFDRLKERAYGNSLVYFTMKTGDMSSVPMIATAYYRYLELEIPNLGNHYLLQSYDASDSEHAFSINFYIEETN
jgi:hypothetical protein